MYAVLGGSMFLVFLFCRFEKTSENAVKEKKKGCVLCVGILFFLIYLAEYFSLF